MLFHAFYNKVSTADVYPQKHPLTWFEYLIHGYIRLNQAKHKITKISTDILAIIEYFYPGYCIYQKPWDLKPNHTFKILHTISSLCDNPNYLYLPYNILDSFEIISLGNTLYTFQSKNQELHILDLKVPSNDLICYKTSNKWIIDNQHQTVGCVISDWCTVGGDSRHKHINIPGKSTWKIKKMLHTRCCENLLLTEDGTLYKARGNNHKVYDPFPDFDLKVIHIVNDNYGSDNDSVLLIDENYNLWVMGSKQNGVLGLADDVKDIRQGTFGEIKDKPVKNPFFDDKKVMKVYCRQQRSCVILENGDCYLFGRNLFAQS